jgi:hypothetical protein
MALPGKSDGKNRAGFILPYKNTEQRGGKVFPSLFFMNHTNMGIIVNYYHLYFPETSTKTPQNLQFAAFFDIFQFDKK